MTKDGLIKRTDLKEFDNIRKSGKIAITLKEDDELISVRKTAGDSEIIIGASNGRIVRFNEDEVRIMGRTAAGVRGISLEEAKVVGGETITKDQEVLVVTENGYGKKSRVNDYRETSRGSKGVKAINITEKNGPIVSVKLISDNKDAIIMTDSGMTMRMSLDQVSVLGRATQGVRLINLKDEQHVATVSLVDKDNISKNSFTIAMLLFIFFNLSSGVKLNLFFISSSINFILLGSLFK